MTKSAKDSGHYLQMLAGGAMIAMAGPFFDGTALPMIVMIALCAVVTMTLSERILPRVKRLAWQG